MKTDDLITALAADTLSPGRAPAHTLRLAALFGGLLSAIVLLGLFGLRGDLVPALATWRFDAKLAIVSVAVIVALADCIRLAAPTATGWASRASLLVPALLIAAVGLELLSVPRDALISRAVGSNALVCVLAIPALALAPLLLGLWAMRSGAPVAPVAAGAAVGRLAAAIAATLYALHCFDDSPLFVALWYSLATLPVMLLGAVAGRVALRW